MAALVENARAPRWRLWARDSDYDQKDVLKARGYSWSPGELDRPRCWFRDVPEADKAGEIAWLRETVLGPARPVCGLRVTARERYWERCWD